MSQTGKQSPLGVNVNSSLLQNIGLRINPRIPKYVGSSKTNDDYVFGEIITTTCLRWLTYAINEGYKRRNTIGTDLYTNLINIGAGSIPILGNSKPSTYLATDPSGEWTSGGTPATTGYYTTGTTGQGQSASWLPYTVSNPNRSVTQWGFLRLWALQAWYEFNWNGDPSLSGTVSYRDFLSAFMTAAGYIGYSNTAINATKQSQTYLDGVYSNMNDLISADITGVSLALPAFATDCIRLGKVIDLSKITTFGLPSTLLQTISRCNAITQALGLALLASGLVNSEIESIANGPETSITKLQEQKIYSAFLIIVGQDLVDILYPLGCRTEGLTSLADLLDVKKMFPTSYQSLTVGIYNPTTTPTNSKTYYNIYTNTSVNSRLSNPEIAKQIGTYIPPGTPPIVDSTTPLTKINIQTLKEGFGSYLDGILPNDIAIAAGAFSTSMQQIKNIQRVTFQQFAQIVQGIETIKDLPLINGTSVPTDLTLANQAHQIIALGSGVYGTYTMSDFFGSMSGLPYMWEEMYNGIKKLETTKLKNIYDQLFLAVSWRQGTVNITYELDALPLPYVPPGPQLYSYSFLITSISVDDPGGGYGRGGAPPPTVTFPLASDAVATITIGTDSTKGPDEYGRITNVTLINPGSWTVYAIGADPTPPDPGLVATVQAPPTSTLPVNSNGSKATGGNNSANGTLGWDTPELMPATTQAYIDQANTEINRIKSSNAAASNNLNTIYNYSGSQLTVEQRARYIGIPAVPSGTRETKLNPFPMTIYSFTDSIPNYALQTLPHMAAQTLEAIADTTTVGGQSIIGMMRQQRNNSRTVAIGVDLDNNINGELPAETQMILQANGTAPEALVGINVPGVGIYTAPSILINGALTTIPRGYYDQNKNQCYVTSSATKVNEVSAISNILKATNAKTSVVTAGPRLPTGAATPCDSGDNLPGDLSEQPDTDDSRTNTVIPSNYNVKEAIDDVSKCNCDCWVD